MDKLSIRFINDNVKFFHVFFSGGSTGSSVRSPLYYYDNYYDRSILRELFRGRSRAIVIIDRAGKLVHYQSYQRVYGVKNVIEKLLMEDDNQRSGR